MADGSEGYKPALEDQPVGTSQQATGAPTSAGAMQQPVGAYPPTSTGGYQQPAGAYPPTSAGGFQQPAGAYPPTYAGGFQQPTGAYPPAPAVGFQQPAGVYPPTSAGEFKQPPGAQYPGTYTSQPGMVYGQSHTMVVTTQPVPGVVAVAPRPPDYTIPAILACLFCFWPTGIAAIYYAIKSNNLTGQGDMSGAQNASNTARTLLIVSVVVGTVWIGLLIILAATGSFSRNRYYYY